MTRDHNLKTYGAIFPIQQQNVDPLFNQEKNVFVKFTNFTKLKKHMIIIFYSKKKLIGEGTIQKTERIDPETAWNQYKNKIFLNKEEFEDYVNISPITKQERKKRNINIFHLKLNKFKNPITCHYVINAAGQYISKEEYQTIKGISNNI